MNDNQELLTWAVENITEWDHNKDGVLNDDYTHLRSDSTYYPFYTKDGNLGWQPSRTFPNDWATDNHFSHLWFKNLDKEFSTDTLQVITKQEWQLAKANKLGNHLGELLVEARSKTLCKHQGGHIHAHLMAEYAIVAKTNPEPWREFQVQWDKQGEWYEVELLYFSAKHNYRRKPSPPKTMKIVDIVVEACPLKEAPPLGSAYYHLLFGYKGFYSALMTWDGYDGDEEWIKIGCLFKTNEEAQAVADALNNIYKKAVDEAWNS